MNYNILPTIILIIAVFMVPTAASYTSQVNHNGGTMTSKSDVYQSDLDGKYTFGTTGTLKGTMNEQGATSATLTLGRSAATRNLEVDATTSNKYLSSTEVQTLGMLNSFDNAGVTDLKSNRPTSICDAENMLDTGSNGSSSRYPSDQTYSFMTGTMADGVNDYKSDIGLVNEKLLSSTRLDASNGYLMSDMLSSTTKGFNKSEASFGYNNQIHDRNLLNSNETVGINSGLDITYDGFGSAFDKVLNSTDKDEVVNQTTVTNETVSNITFGNQTP